LLEGRQQYADQQSHYGYDNKQLHKAEAGLFWLAPSNRICYWISHQFMVQSALLAFGY
jgi:hypothetical protein